MVAAALRDRTALHEADGGDERRVQDGDGEHEQRDQQGGNGRLGHLPARGQPERGEHEPEHLAAGVAHEHRRRSAGAEVEGEEPERREPDRQREHEQQVLLVQVHGVDREERGGDHRQRPGEAVHVVEQVEGVRHADQPEPAEERGQDAVGDDLDAEAGAEDARRRGDLRASLAQGGSERTSSTRPAANTIAAPPRMPKSSASAPTACTATASSTAAAKPAKMPTPPKVGVACSCQRSRRGAATSLRGGGRAQERPDRERGDGQGDEADDGAHRAASLSVGSGTITKATDALLGECLGNCRSPSTEA